MQTKRNMLWTGAALSLLLWLLALPCAALAEPQAVAQNERLTLYYDAQESQIILFDALTGEEWRSTPADFEQDKQATGMNKANRQSDLIVTYHNESFVPNQINSYTGSIKKGDFTWTLIDGGVEIRYWFPKQGFIIPVRYTLHADYLAASVLSEQIEEDVWTLEAPPEEPDKADKAASAKKKPEKQTVMSVALLPFMGAAAAADAGYLIVPDGCGALIHFDNGRTNAAIYQQAVYGRDDALSLKRAATHTYDVNMPLFGMVRNGRALLAVVDNGAFQSQLTAATAGQQTGYANAYFTVQYSHLESNTLMSGSPHSKDVTLATRVFRDMGDYTVRYYPLPEQNATYATVALAYRALLGLTDMPAAAASDTAAPLQVEMIASVPSVNTFLGVPYAGVRVLTAYRDAQDTLLWLHEAGVGNVNLRYTGWSRQSCQGKLVTTLALDNRLGGKGAFARLQEAAWNTGASLTLTVDMLTLYKGGSRTLFSSTQNVNSTSLQARDFLQSTGYQDPEGKPYSLLRPDLAPDMAQKAAKNLGTRVDGLSLSALGNTVYSNFGKGGVSRTAAGAYWARALAALRDGTALLTARLPAAYALPYVRQADEAPCVSSAFDVTDTDIPFYQLVTHGAMTLFGEPLNEAGDYDAALLRLIEYGTYPCFRLIARAPSLLAGTDFAHWYALGLDDWREDMVAVSAYMAPLARYAAMRMTGHERWENGVSVTTYANGDRVLVNYGAAEATALGVSVPARGYAIKEAER